MQLEWFPARFRHILDNLIAHALQRHDSKKNDTRVDLHLCEVMGGYELQLRVNEPEIDFDYASSAAELFHRSAPSRSAGLGVGIAVVRMLAEQCCGTLRVASEDSGATVTLFLPHYELDDHVE